MVVFAIPFFTFIIKSRFELFLFIQYLKNFKTILPNDTFTPYIYGGIGGVFDIDTPFDPPAEEDTSGMNFQYGLGIKYNANPNLSIIMKAENNHTSSDAIENVVNGVRNDFYYNFSLGLEWRFGNSFNIR